MTVDVEPQPPEHNSDSHDRRRRSGTAKRLKFHQRRYSKQQTNVDCQNRRCIEAARVPVQLMIPHFDHLTEPLRRCLRLPLQDYRCYEAFSIGGSEPLPTTSSRTPLRLSLATAVLNPIRRGLSAGGEGGGTS